MSASTRRRKPVKAKPASSREKVRAHRERLPAAGLRPVQVWIPDTRTPAFARAAHRESLRVAASRSEADDQAFIDSISIWNEA